MNARVAESLAMEHRLRRALEDGTLSLHYQPKINMASGEVAGLGRADPLERFGARLGAAPSSSRCSRRPA